MIHWRICSHLSEERPGTTSYDGNNELRAKLETYLAPNKGCSRPTQETMHTLKSVMSRGPDGWMSEYDNAEQKHQDPISDDYCRNGSL